MVLYKMSLQNDEDVTVETGNIYLKNFVYDKTNFHFLLNSKSVFNYS